MNWIQIASPFIAGISVCISLMSLTISIRINSDNKKIRDRIRSELVQSMIAIYRSLSDYNSYLSIAFHNGRPMSIDLVIEQYKSTLQDISKLRSRHEHYIFINSLVSASHSIFKDRGYITENLGNYSIERAKSIKAKLTGSAFKDAVSIELNTFWSLHNTIASLTRVRQGDRKYILKLLDDVPEDDIDRFEEERICIMKTMLNFSGQVELLVDLMELIEVPLNFHINSITAKPKTT